ncbi:C-C motif chemokine 3-like 1 [Acridotheres tristis]
MRILAASLAVLLLVAICSLAEADRRVSRNAAHSKNDETKEMCCFAYSSVRIPRRMIHSAYRTSAFCSMQAVVMVTRSGKQVCTDPKARWVQKYLEDLELLEN